MVPVFAQSLTPQIEEDLKLSTIEIKVEENQRDGPAKQHGWGSYQKPVAMRGRERGSIVVRLWSR